MKAKLSATTGLVASLVAAKGEAFHYSSLQSGLEAARAAGVQVATCIDDLVSVRHVTSLGDSMQWMALVQLLESGLQEASATQIRKQGITYAVESIFRSGLGSQTQTSSSDEAQKKSFLQERMKHALDLIASLRSVPSLWAQPGLAMFVNELEQLETIVNFLGEEQQESLPDKETVAAVESARTLLSSKTAQLTKCMSCLPAGVMLMEMVQETLAAYHNQIALITNMEKALPGSVATAFSSCFRIYFWLGG